MISPLMVARDSEVLWFLFLLEPLLYKLCFLIIMNKKHHPLNIVAYFKMRTFMPIFGTAFLSCTFLVHLPFYSANWERGALLLLLGLG